MFASPAVKDLVLQALPYATMLIDQAGLIQFANQSAADILQKTTLEIQGERVHDFIADETLLIPGRVTYYRLNGRLGVLRACALNVDQAGPYTGGTLLIFSEHRLGDHAFFESAMYLSMVASKFRSSLSPSRAYLDLMWLGAAGPLSLEQHKQLEVPRQNMRHLIAFAEDLLEINRLWSPQSLALEQIPLHPFVEELCQFLAKKFESRSIDLITRYLQPPAFLTADAKRLSWILLRLLDSAWRYTKPGGTVVVTITGHPGTVQFDIKDTGVGIDAGLQTVIFRPLVRGSRDTNDDWGGGLSLFIIRHYVERHGGTIWFESAEGVGTTFSFALPTERASEQ